MTLGTVPAWLLLALASMVLVGTADLLLRRATLHGITVASFMVLQSWFFGPTALAWTGATGTLRWSPGVLWGPVAGVLAFVATFSFLRSLQAPGGQVSVSAPIYRLSLVVTAGLAIVLLGERLTWSKLTGLVLAAAAVLLLTEVSPRRSPHAPGDWAGRSGVMHGAAPGLLIFGQFCTLTTISFVYARWKEGGLRFTRTIWTHAPICGVLNSSGRVLLAWSLISGGASAAVPVSQMSFVFTFLLAAPLFGEAVTTRKLTGLGAAVLAILAFYR